MTNTLQLDPAKIREMAPTETAASGSVSLSPFDLPRAIRWGPGPDTIGFFFEYSDDEATGQEVSLDTDMNPPVNIVHGKYSGKILAVLVKTIPSTLTSAVFRALAKRLEARSERIERVNQRLNYRLVAQVFENLPDSQKREEKV